LVPFGVSGISAPIGAASFSLALADFILQGFEGGGHSEIVFSYQIGKIDSVTQSVPVDYDKSKAKTSSFRKLFVM
jgi:hypothetical protein